MKLKDKVVIITGASKGIGEAIAHGMAKAGAKVVVSSRKQDAVDAVAATLRNDYGVEAIGIAANAGNLEDCATLVQKTIEHFGGVDVLVNNAATNPVFGPLESMDLAAFDKIMAVNVKGPMELSRLCLPHMEARGGGSIIHIGSVEGIKPERMMGFYSISKAAMLQMTKVMAKEWGHKKVRVNVLCPGLVQTKFSEALWQNDSILEHFVQQVPLGRMALPEEMAGLAVFLASSESSYCTGGVYVADGGYLA